MDTCIRHFQLAISSSLFSHEQRQHYKFRLCMGLIANGKTVSEGGQMGLFAYHRELSRPSIIFDGLMSSFQLVTVFYSQDLPPNHGN